MPITGFRHHQACGLQFYADDEQQKDNAELSDMPDFLDLVDETEPPWTDNGAGSQVPQHRTEAQALEERNGDDSRRQQDQYTSESRLA